jgi:hypothetical protein
MFCVPLSTPAGIVVALEANQPTERFIIQAIRSHNVGPI